MISFDTKKFKLKDTGYSFDIYISITKKNSQIIH